MIDDIYRAEQWWDEWQLRILVLGSLGLHWFLLLAAPMRNYTIPRWFRTLIWAAYISADALAIYALATLFNRHARESSSSSSSCDYGTKGSSLEVLWAPLLLVYLGGREEITAYTIEDNELWTRHTVTLVSQVTVAVYAFCKSWPISASDDRNLLLSAILLFVVGIISFIEKPWALRRASIKRLVAMSSVMKGKRESPGGWDWCFADVGDRYKCWKALPEGGMAPILSQGDKVHMMLSDLSLFAAEVTLKTRQKTGQQILEPLEIYQGRGRLITMKPWMHQAFGLIYTRANVIFTPAYLACHVLLVPSLYMAAIMLFATSHKEGYDRTDVRTTYALLCFTLVLDVFGLVISELMYWFMSSKAKLPALCENIPGYNLIDSVLWTMEAPMTTGLLLKCARRFGYKEGYFVSVQGNDDRNNLFEPVCQFITMELVSVSDRMKNADLSSYRSFTKVGYWTQSKMEYVKKHRDDKPMIWKSLCRSPFDASVLIWHIATDLCFRCKPPRHFRCRPPHTEVIREVCTEAISNYMAYLLNFRPEMLMTGSRQHLYTEAMQHLQHILTQVTEGMTEDQKKRFIGGEKQQQPLEGEILEKIAGEASSLKEEKYYSVLNDACKLAVELMRIEDDSTRWGLMYRVWVGKLCYSASMCRGYLHAKSLGEGGEFLSYVWLIISLKGAKTLADKLQMADPEEPDPAEEGGSKGKDQEDGDKKQEPTGELSLSDFMPKKPYL